MNHYEFYEGLRDDLVASGVLPARGAEPLSPCAAVRRLARALPAPPDEPFVPEWKPRADYRSRPPNPCRSCAEQWMEPVAAGATEDCEVCR